MASDLRPLAGQRVATTVTARDEAMRDHLVHGVPVLPGVFLLDLVLRLVRRSGVDPSEVELRRCLFLAPVVDRDGTGRRVQAEIGDALPGGGLQVTVKSRSSDMDEWMVNCRAEIRPAPPVARMIDMGGLRAAASSTADIDELYGFVRGLDIHHTGFMKASGTVQSGDGYALAHMRLGPDAESYLEHFQVHPVVLDFSTLVPMWLFDPAHRAVADHPFIPIYIESFRAIGTFGVENVVHVPRPATGRLDSEVFEADIDVHALDGSLLASIGGFRAKRIRSSELITGLVGANDDRADEPETIVVANGHSSLVQLISELVAHKLGRAIDDVDPDSGFYELGLNSVQLLGIAGALEEQLSTQLYPTLLFEYPTVRALADHLRAEGHEPTATNHPIPVPQPVVRARPVDVPEQLTSSDELAIVGLAGRYPGAETADQLWEVLRDGRNLIREIPPERWDHGPYWSPERGIPGRSYSKWGAFCEGVDEFDPAFFHLSERQAELMDPHERLFLQTAWEAIEDAGHTPERLSDQVDGAVGVFAGVMWNDYTLHGLDRLRKGNPDIAGSWSSSLANRVSYTFDFQGPSLTVDTACSAALAALHLARESIRRGECRVALVGGVNLSLHPYKYLRLAELGLLATGARCRPFGKDADGYVPGEGVGAVLVRPLADALNAGDHIYAVVRGSALRHSGRTGGFSVPGQDAQVRVVSAALADAGVPAETVTYLEAHASGTSLGDQIELEALTTAYGATTKERGFCAIGSIKSSIGHLEAAAGIAGLTKLLLCLRHKTIPGFTDIGELNPAIRFDGTPFYLPERSERWDAPVDPATLDLVPRRAALSAFGAGGANVHLIVEEHKVQQRPSVDSSQPQVVPLSARTEEQQRAVARRLVDHLRAHPDVRLADVAYTLQQGRRAMTHRIALVVNDVAELASALDDVAAGRTPAVPAFRGQVSRFESAVSAASVPSGLSAPAMAEAWVSGRLPGWREIPGARRVSLPTYPFERQRYWLGSRDDVRKTTDSVLFYEPRWSRKPLPEFGNFADATVVVFDTDDVRVAAMREQCRRVIQVRPGASYARLSDDLYEVCPGDTGNARTLVDALRQSGGQPAAVLQLWNLRFVDRGRSDTSALMAMFVLCQAFAIGLPDVLPVLFAYAAGAESPALAAVGGLARSVRLEQPKLAVTVARFSADLPGASELLAEAADVDSVEVRYSRAGREVLGYAPIQHTPEPVELARDGGVYLITGGTGGLGRHTARLLAEQATVSIALTGRSAPSPATAEVVAELESLGARAMYVAADVADRDDLERCVAEVVGSFGPLTGVIHCAGVIDDALLVNKKPEAIASVLAAKVHGAVNLDQVTRESALDYLILYSSTASVLGSAGATDYASANRFLDSFAAWREDSRERGERRGRTLAINWPLWRDGGMRIEPAVENMVLRQVGMEPLATTDGLAALGVAMAQQRHQLVVLNGDRERLERRLPIASVVQDEPDNESGLSLGVELSAVADYTAALVRQVLNGQGSTLSDDGIRGATFMELGMSSRQLVELVSTLNRDLSLSVQPTVVFKYPDVDRLADYLTREHPDAFANRDDLGRTSEPSAIPVGSHRRGTDAPIAIIGMAGRFPGSNDLAAFWDNLAHGRDLVSPVPAERWDHSRYHDQTGTRPGGTDCGHGGFLSEVARFDAEFFGVTKAEAEGMDPQLRLLLEVLYETAEHAGVASTLRGSATGTFVGRCFQDYADEMIARGRTLGAYDVTGTAVVMAANRVSHYFDLTGPSLAVDTACSSSLYALHLATEALRRGECELAFAAGTNLILSPQHYLRSSAIGALSPSGRCYSFDSRADGYVPSEAVAAVLLKPLDKAMADGDPIQAVIRSVAVNHGGHASSITAPNPVRQTELLVRAWTEAGIDPESLTYLEAHGTGTSLGDPIEVDAATAAFRRFTERTGFCALGSAKAHLGHAEGAAGLVSVIKTVLSMRHGLIPAMPTFRQPNPYCQLDGSPLWINTEPVHWEPASDVRRAGVSSFGFGGAYAHAVLEEAPILEAQRPTRRTWLFPFSARDAERLRQLVRRHRDHLSGNPDLPLDRVAATLCRGREPMAHRMVVIADSLPDLIRHCDAFLADQEGPQRVYGQPGPDAERELVVAAQRWVAGDADEVPAPDVPRLSLPGYPFGGGRYWIQDLPTPVESREIPADNHNDGLASELNRFVRESGFPGRRVANGMDRLDDLVRRWCRHLLSTGTSVPDAVELRARLADPERYGRMADALADLLTRAPRTPIAGDLAGELASLVADHPELTAWAELVRVCLPRLPEILAGTADALEVYFSPEHPDLLFRVYSDSLIANHHNDLVARAVAGQVRALSRAHDRPIRILEIGGGTGGTTRSVLAALERTDTQVHYTFTDVSPSFLPAARAAFADSRIHLDFRVLDLDRHLETQGFQPGSADIVIAANAVHATKCVADSVTRIGRVLTGGGILVLQELTRARDSVTAMIGALPGYWAGLDPEQRLPHAPLLDVGMWRTTLADHGFTRTGAFGSADLDEREFDNAVLVSAAPEGTRFAPAAASDAVEEKPPPPNGAAADPADIRWRLREVIGAFFGLPVEEIQPDATFDRFGMDSLSSIQLVRSLEPEFGKLSKVLFYEYPTINELADHLATKIPQPSADTPQPASATPSLDPVAIVGMAGKFAKSRDLAEWWRHLSSGTDLVTEIPAERFDWREVYGDPTRSRGTVNSRWGSFCDGVDEFDAAFFGVTPFEAELMDPQQRIMLQTAWKAIEDAGHRPSELRGTRTGVFVGATSRDYDWLLQAAGRHREGHFVTGSGHCLIANRLSYQLDLRGPSEAVDTACSSSLTALHRGVRSIQTGECDAAIVGGVHLFLTADLFVALGQLGVMSPDGRCATFDAKANGMVRGEGAVAVVLKPLSQALADGDTIHAVVRASGVSHGGGRHASSLMLPEPAAQADLIASVCRSAGVDPRTITYVEAHGTGTQIGDPVEIKGLRKAFAELTGLSEDEPVTAWCGVGSVKSNVGHLESAAGLTGVVKTILAMRHGMLPPSIHFSEPNPLLELEGSPFYVVDRLQPWASPHSPRRAAVSAFGLGGTNAHVLLEEFPTRNKTDGADDGPEVVMLSARTPTRLRAYAQELRDFLKAQGAEDDPAVPLADIAYTLRVGREPMKHRLAIVASGSAELTNLLLDYLNGASGPAVFTGTAETETGGEHPGDPVEAARRWVDGGPAWQPYGRSRSPRRVSLPTYPFEPERHWVAQSNSAQPRQMAAVDDLPNLLQSLSEGQVTVDEVDRILGGVS